MVTVFIPRPFDDISFWLRSWIMPQRSLLINSPRNVTHFSTLLWKVGIIHIDHRTNNVKFPLSDLHNPMKNYLNCSGACCHTLISRESEYHFLALSKVARPRTHMLNCCSDPVYSRVEFYFSHPQFAYKIFTCILFSIPNFKNRVNLEKKITSVLINLYSFGKRSGSVGNY